MCIPKAVAVYAAIWRHKAGQQSYISNIEGRVLGVDCGCCLSSVSIHVHAVRSHARGAVVGKVAQVRSI